MAAKRRDAYTRVERYNKVEGLAKGRGDTQYKALNCLNPQCDNFIYFPHAESSDESFCVTCDKCGHELRRGRVEHILDYDLKMKDTGEVVESGEFLVEHAKAIDEAPLYKYCVLCHALKLNEEFDRHSSRRTGRQSECNSCKQLYNGVKNKTRIRDQHIEAARNREFFSVLCAELDGKINIEGLLARYSNRCFGCNEAFFDDEGRSVLNVHWDHMLPVKYLWPLVDWNATPLCQDCNQAKSAKWPSKFYTKEQLKRLTAITGQSYDILSSKVPVYHKDSVEKLKDPEYVFQLLEKYGARYDSQIKRMDARINADLNFSFLQVAIDDGRVSKKWLDD